jgi:transposase
MNRNGLRNIILQEYKLDHNVTTTTANINNAWGDGTINRKTVKTWFNQFDSGNFDLKDKEGRGRKSVVNIARLQSMVMANPRQSTKEYARRLKVGTSSVKRAFKKLKMVKKCDELVAYDLSES